MNYAIGEDKNHTIVGHSTTLLASSLYAWSCYKVFSLHFLFHRNTIILYDPEIWVMYIDMQLRSWSLCLCSCSSQEGNGGEFFVQQISLFLSFIIISSLLKSCILTGNTLLRRRELRILGWTWRLSDSSQHWYGERAWSLGTTN